MKNKNISLISGLLLITGLLFAYSCKEELPEELNCKGDPDPNAVCIEIFEPVCGCDLVTYSNSCYAAAAGVQEFTAGECD